MKFGEKSEKTKKVVTDWEIAAVSNKKSCRVTVRKSKNTDSVKSIF